MLLRYNVFTLVWAFVILFLTLIPGKNMPELSLWSLLTFDKAAHAFVYAILVLLMIIGFTKQYAYVNLKFNAIPVAFLIGFAYGMTLEIIQNFIPERSFQLTDALANTLGCCIGTLLFYIIYKL